MFCCTFWHSSYSPPSPRKLAPQNLVGGTYHLFPRGLLHRLLPLRDVGLSRTERSMGPLGHRGLWSQGIRNPDACASTPYQTFSIRSAAPMTRNHAQTPPFPQASMALLMLIPFRCATRNAPQILAKSSRILGRDAISAPSPARVPSAAAALSTAARQRTNLLPPQPPSSDGIRFRCFTVGYRRHSLFSPRWTASRLASHRPRGLPSVLTIPSISLDPFFPHPSFLFQSPHFSRRR